jgi:hypothetical protein
VEVRVQLELQELQEPMVLRGQLAYLESTEPRGLQASKVMLELLGQLEQLAFLEGKVLQARLD